MSGFTEAELQWISDTAWDRAYRFRLRNAGETLTVAEAAYLQQLEHTAETADRLLGQS